MMTSPNSRSHCWICDDHGGLYVLKDISVHCRDSQTKPTWSKVDSGFKSIYAGYRGLVCGIKDRSLYVRKCVNHDTPVGTGWEMYACDVLKVMPGRTCIVRRSSKGRLHAAKVNLETGVLDWKPIPPYREEIEGGNTEQLHHVVDGSDRLFSITGNGAVFCYELLSRDPYWYEIAAPPDLAMNQGIIGKLFNMWSTNGDCNGDRDWVGVVGYGLECIWCLRKSTKEVWQLVIGCLNNAPKTNWVKVMLPLSDEENIVSLSACKSARGGLYVIVKGEGHWKLVYCSFSSAGGCDRMTIELPVRYPCWSIAICSIPRTVVVGRQAEVSAGKKMLGNGHQVRKYSDDLYPLNLKMGRGIFLY